MVSLKAQVSIQVSNSGSVTKGKKARLGERPCTLSSNIWRLRLLVKMCCSHGVRSLKSLESRMTSISSGRQKNPNCLSVSLSNWRSFSVSYLCMPSPPWGSRNAKLLVWSRFFFRFKTLIYYSLYILQLSQSSSACIDVSGASIRISCLFMRSASISPEPS